jgi:hypothetical protein
MKHLNTYDEMINESIVSNLKEKIEGYLIKGLMRLSDDDEISDAKEILLPYKNMTQEEIKNHVLNKISPINEQFKWWEKGANKPGSLKNVARKAIDPYGEEDWGEDENDPRRRLGRGPDGRIRINRENFGLFIKYLITLFFGTTWQLGKAATVITLLVYAINSLFTNVPDLLKDPES